MTSNRRSPAQTTNDKVPSTVKSPLLYRLIKWSFVVIISIILLINLTLYWVDYGGTRLQWQLIINPLLLPIAAVVIGGLYWLLSRRGVSRRLPVDAIFVVASLLFLVLQIFLVRQYYFETAWDAATVRDSAINIVNGNSPDPGWWPDYYTVNPNNRTVVSLFVVVIKVMSALSIDEPLFGLILFQCAISWLTGVILYFTVKRLTGRRSDGCFAWVIYAILIGLSPWVSIPYTDGVGLLLPILLLFIYTLRPTKWWWRLGKWLAVGALGYLSLQIKPQTTIIFIAIMIMAVLAVLIGRIKYRQPIVTWQHTGNLGMVVVGMAIVMVPLQIVNNKLVPIESNRELPIAHYLMMGMNDQTDGIYSGNDVWFISLDGVYRDGDGSNPASRIVTTDEITERDIPELISRLRRMGFSGTTKLLIRKSLVNFNDGVFAWSGEGNFYWSVKPAANELAEAVREIYYIPDPKNGVSDAESKYAYLQTVEQGVWLAVLLFSLLSVIKADKSHPILVAMLGIMGLVLYELLFEARARYIYTYVPIFIMLATIGLSQFNQWRQARRHWRKA